MSFVPAVKSTVAVSSSSFTVKVAITVPAVVKSSVAAPSVTLRVVASSIPTRFMTTLVVAGAPLSSVTVTGIVIVNGCPSARYWYAPSLGSKL